VTINHQDDLPEGTSAPVDQAAGLTSQGAARRRFTRAGIGATGVLATLVSQPGMAQTVCTTPSGSLSNGLTMSQQPTPRPLCAGVSPGAYSQQLALWPAGVDPESLFKTIFTCGPHSAKLGACKLKDVFKAKADIDPQNVGRHMLAAYFNLLRGETTVITMPMLKNIWKEFQDTGGGKSGYYRPSATVKWYGPDIVRYLTSTFHQPK
jgi:hypothetical protein